MKNFARGLVFITNIFNFFKFFLDFVDSSGLRFWYSDQLRKYDAGVLYVGTRSNYALTMPPGQPKWKSTSHCPAACTQKVSTVGLLKDWRAKGLES